TIDRTANLPVIDLPIVPEPTLAPLPTETYLFTRALAALGPGKHTLELTVGSLHRTHIATLTLACPRGGAPIRATAAALRTRFLASQTWEASTQEPFDDEVLTAMKRHRGDGTPRKVAVLGVERRRDGAVEIDELTAVVGF